MKWVYWAWTAIGLGAVVFVFVGARGWDTDDYLVTGMEFFVWTMVVVVVPSWALGYVVLWALRRLVLALAGATKRHRLGAHH